MTSPPKWRFFLFPFDRRLLAKTILEKGWPGGMDRAAGPEMALQTWGVMQVAQRRACALRAGLISIPTAELD
ncbi:hypothetical protein [Deinococcus multiflagellatus]|uniref:hypothetical protein n=1 Tax=Deinococcus multiflagellatus TaxID=1656887 RepID=UPI001CCD89C5|nr:hypothetical protein [Deinococcus multiflagellatus]MBZ9714850.1 hypothetical protein [Deinococcus multiflagellatus]